MNNENVTVHLTREQWNLLFHMLNQSGSHIQQTVEEAARAAFNAGESVGKCVYSTRARLINQIINTGHPAL